MSTVGQSNKLSINKGFFIAWILTFFILYSTSYIWHGIILNDLSRISYPKDVFFLLIATFYFVLSLILVFLIQVLPLSMRKSYRGIVIGASLGVFIYLIAFVFGVSFYANPSLKHILFDVTWQVFEESFGGFLAGGLLMLMDLIFKPGRKKATAKANIE